MDKVRSCSNLQLDLFGDRKIWAFLLEKLGASVVSKNRPSAVFRPYQHNADFNRLSETEDLETQARASFPELRQLDLFPDAPQQLSGRSTLSENRSAQTHPQSRFRGPSLRRCLLDKADFFAADLYLYDFESARLRQANFKHAHLERTNLKGADLTRADLEGADCRRADFQDTVLKKANLCGADLRASRNLTVKQIRSAKIDSNTRLPYRFIIEWLSPNRYKLDTASGVRDDFIWDDIRSLKYD